MLTDSSCLEGKSLKKVFENGHFFRNIFQAKTKRGMYGRRRFSLWLASETRWIKYLSTGNFLLKSHVFDFLQISLN